MGTKGVSFYECRVRDKLDQNRRFGSHCHNVYILPYFTLTL